MTDVDVTGAADEPPDDPRQLRPSIWKIALRIGLALGALVVSFVVLKSAFDTLDFAEVWRTIRSLDDAEILALLSMWVLWLATQGLQTAALLPGLPVRRGVVAFLGPAAVASVIPGPSDLPVRHRMMRSWGCSNADTTLAVAAGGIFSIGIKLLLPIAAAAGLLISDTPIDGTLRTIVTIIGIVAIGVAVVAFALSSERRAVFVTRAIGPIWRAGLRLFRRSDDGDLTERVLQARAQAIDTLRDRWLIAAWSATLTAATRYALLLMSLRFMDVGPEQISWAQVFVVYALVQGLTAIPITAGDVGVSEVALIGFTVAITGDDFVNQVTAGVLVFRLLTWLLLIPVGFSVLTGWRWLLRREARRRSTVSP